MPRTLVDLRQTLEAVSRLSGRVQQETESTAPELRRTLRQVDQTAVTARQTAITAGQTALTARDTAISARRAADEASQTLGRSRPLLLRILRDLQGVTGSTERMVRSLLGSGAPTAPSTPDVAEPPPQSPALEGSGNDAPAK